MISRRTCEEPSASRTPGGRVPAHSAGVRPAVAVVDLLVVAGGRQRDARPRRRRSRGTTPPARAGTPRRGRGRPPRRRPARRRRGASAFSASSAESSVRTPLPPARPSALSTAGKPNCSMALRASSADCRRRAAVGIPWRPKNSLAKTFEDSICAARRLGRRSEAPAWRTRPRFRARGGARARRPSGRCGASRRSRRSRRCPRRRDGQAVGDLGDARVAGRAVDLLDDRALRERPAERVLPPAAADDEDLHSAAL